MRRAWQLIRQHEIPLVYTTSLPYTSNRIGLALQRRGVKWVADYRDPGTYAARLSSPVGRVYEGQRHIERETLRRADAVTVASSVYPMIFRDLHRLAARTPIRFIPTGADDEYVQASRRGGAQDGKYIVYCGEFLREYGPDFLELYAKAIARTPSPAKLLFVGRLDVNRRNLTPVVRRLQLEPHVEFRDHVPQAELYSIIRGAMAGVLAPGSDTHWWCFFAKLVDFLALQKPVLALVPDPSEARIQLSAAGLGIFLDGNADEATDRLAAFLSGRLAAPAVNANACSRFLASRQVRDFAEVFEGCLAGPDVVLAAGV